LDLFSLIFHIVFGAFWRI